MVNIVTFGDETVDFNKLWVDKKRTPLGVTLNPITEMNLGYTEDGFISLISIGFEIGESLRIGSVRNGRMLEEESISSEETEAESAEVSTPSEGM